MATAFIDSIISEQDRKTAGSDIAMVREKFCAQDLNAY